MDSWPPAAPDDSTTAPGPDAPPNHPTEPVVFSYRGTLNFTGEFEGGLEARSPRWPKYVSTDPEAALAAVREHLRLLPGPFVSLGLVPDPGVIRAVMPASVWERAHVEGLFFSRTYSGWGVIDSVETHIRGPEGAALWDRYVDCGWQLPQSPGRSFRRRTKRPG
jgi:hypothetical protein